MQPLGENALHLLPIDQSFLDKQAVEQRRPSISGCAKTGIESFCTAGQPRHNTRATEPRRQLAVDSSRQGFSSHHSFDLPELRFAPLAPMSA